MQLKLVSDHFAMEVTRKNFLTISKVEDQVKFPCTVEDTMTSKAMIIHLDHVAQR